MESKQPISPKTLLYKEECYAIQGAIFEVYKELGVGFVEAVYQECLIQEFTSRNIPFASQVELPVFYKDKQLNQNYRADFICFEKILIELKVVQAVDDIHRAQVINYLKISGLRLGLLVNFYSHPRVTIERITL
jgi:GxxExxY protein